MSKEFLRRILVPAAASVALVVPGAVWFPTAALAQTTITYDTDSNWAGYFMEYQNPDPNTDPLGVNGAWIVPRVTCTENGKAISGEVPTWIGLGGALGDNDLEQIGTDSQCVNGQATYWAWYEFPPAAAVRINTQISHNDGNCKGKSPISPGDNMRADVVDQGFGQFALQLWDYTKNWYCPVLWINQAASAVPLTAEWIVENRVVKNVQQTWPQFKSGVAFLDCLWMQDNKTFSLYAARNLQNLTIDIGNTSVPKDDTSTVTSDVPIAFFIQWLRS